MKAQYHLLYRKGRRRTPAVFSPPSLHCWEEGQVPDHILTYTILTHQNPGKFVSIKNQPPPPSKKVFILLLRFVKKVLNEVKKMYCRFLVQRKVSKNIV